MSSIALRLAATRDLLRRYGAVFRHSWHERKSFEPRLRLPHERQFLPAALELQESPVSPTPRLIMWLLIAFAGLTVLWASFGQIDVVATARGKIVPNDRIKLVQPIETAAVRAIHVTDGQSVRAGQVLVELDATVANADATRFASDHATARLQAARARAMLAAIASGQPPVLGVAGAGDAARLTQEQRTLEGQYAEFTTKRARIDADIVRRVAELRSTREIVHKLEQTLPIAEQRAADFRNLADKSFISRHGFLEREQQRIEQEGDLAAQRSRLAELTAGIDEGRSQRAALIAETRRIALEALNEAEQRGTATGQELVKAESRKGLMRLAAPVDGTVQQLAVHTLGGVVTPAQTLMVVVPRDNALEVEAVIENKDIGFVRPGQDAEAKIDTFLFTRYGTIPARVMHVSNDAVADEKRGLIYPVRVKLERTTIRVDEKTVNLSPGMAVAIEIKTGKRRVIEYFLSPLIQYQDESLRER